MNEEVLILAIRVDEGNKVSVLAQIEKLEAVRGRVKLLYTHHL